MRCILPNFCSNLFVGKSLTLHSARSDVLQNTMYTIAMYTEVSVKNSVSHKVIIIVAKQSERQINAECESLWA